MNLITDDFSYKAKLDTSSISKHQKALKYFFDNFQSASKLNNQIPIFVDTNVLLHYYKISFKARQKLNAFFEENKDRIYLTEQIQKEFIRNREERINEFHLNITETLPNKFKKEIINKIQSFIDDNKTILIDYPFLEEKLSSIKIDCEKNQKKLLKEIETKKTDLNKSKFADELLVLYSQFKETPKLSKEEIELIKKDYDSLRKLISDEQKIKTLLEKPMNAFPGMGDIINKPNDPYGDYIIYHELLKFVKDKNKDVVFLTFDTSKGDWLTKEKQPHIHYVENVYLNTNKSIFILDAKRTFEDLLDISFKSVIPKNIDNLDISSNEKISDLIYLWGYMEKMLRSQVAKMKLTETKRSIYSILQSLVKMKIISYEEHSQLIEIGRIRSAVAHGDFDAYLNLSEIEQKLIILRLEGFSMRFINLDNFYSSDNE